jgi:PRTRC genetic system protein C
MKRTNVTREFIYKSQKLKDPSSNMTQQQVLDHYTNVYPDLITSRIKETIKDGIFQYEFVNELGTKG